MKFSTYEDSPQQHQEAISPATQALAIRNVPEDVTDTTGGDEETDQSKGLGSGDDIS